MFTVPTKCVLNGLNLLMNIIILCSNIFKKNINLYGAKSITIGIHKLSLEWCIINEAIYSDIWEYQIISESHY